MGIIILALAAFLVFKFGIIGKLISVYKKSEAAASIQSLLERQQAMLIFDGTPSTAANRYVEDAWESKPDVFNGKFGKRPHKLSVVLYSLAYMARQYDAQNNPHFGAVMIAAGNVVSEIETNGRYYPFSNVDQALIQESMQIISPIIDRRNAAPMDDDISKIMDL